MNILVSACLLGVNCNYEGKNKKNEAVCNLKNNFNIVPVCPEELGGMTTPRIPSEIKCGKVFNKNGQDVSLNFESGAIEVLKIAKFFDCKYAILKSKSPSCGSNKIYDGTFSCNVIDGDGITAKLLKENDIKVFTENEIEEFLNATGFKK